jgi:hypothetical protein
MIEFGKRLTPDALSGAVWRFELWMRRLELFERIEELVVFAVGDNRRGIDVVAAIVLANLAAEIFGLLLE